MNQSINQIYTYLIIIYNTEAKREWAEKEVDLTGIPEASPNVYELLPEVREAETKRI